MKKKSSIKERLLEFLSYLGIGQTKFESEAGLSRGLVNKVDKGISSQTLNKIAQRYPELNTAWLINGEGKMLKQDENVPPIRTFTENPNEGLPLIPVKAVAGLLQAGEWDLTIMEYDCERYIIPLLERMGAHFYIEVRGDSMMKTYKPGDILGCRAVPLNDLFFQWNKVYVCITNQEPLVKRVKRGKDDDHIMLVSDNEFYEPFELHRSKLLGVALVVGRIGVE